MSTAPFHRPSGPRGSRTFKAVLYDQDGTLLDTETLATKAIQDIIAPFGGLSLLTEVIPSQASANGR